MISDTNQCIHCKKCIKACTFLSKYDIDLSDYSKRNDLAYHCFLCGECKRVCPKGIDGRKISMDLRVNSIKNGFQPEKNGYGMLLFEKQNYLFRNYGKLKSKKVLFAGCNFPSYYPKLTKKIAIELKVADNIHIVYDCCGKPIAELGMSLKENEIINRLKNSLRGVEEITVLCPNCYYYLKSKLNIKVVSIYEKLLELNIGNINNLNIDTLFTPCPDRNTYEFIKPIFNNKVIDEDKVLKNPQCCGAGGCASVLEKDLAKEMKEHLKNQLRSKEIKTYCATCSGVFNNYGLNTSHILCEIMNFTEKPAKGTRSLINRAMCKFK